jgi:hypothetical protein
VMMPKIADLLTPAGCVLALRSSLTLLLLSRAVKIGLPDSGWNMSIP